jgi:hypothetical protein
MGMHFRLKFAGCCCCVLMIGELGFAVPKKHKTTQPPPAPVQEAPPIPQPPPTPEQMPAVPPRVSMSNGMLSISADNSTLGDILTAVRRQTGAWLEVPPSIANERVATNLGPGSPREVLQDLLSGSRFDYIIVGTPQDPNAVQRIILTPRSGGGTGGPAIANNQPMAPSQSNYQPPSDVGETVDEEPQPEPAPPEPPQPQGNPPTGAQPYSNQPNSTQQQQQPKTPEQLLQELQQMQQQQQQRPPRNPQ